MASSGRSNYTPPLKLNTRKRSSRNPERIQEHRRNRRSTTRPHQRQRKRDTYRNRSRRRTASDSSSSLSYRRHRSSSTASKSSISDYHTRNVRSRSIRRYQYRKRKSRASRHRSDDTSSSSSEHNNRYKRKLDLSDLSDNSSFAKRKRSRSRIRSHWKSRSSARKENEFLKKFSSIITGNRFEGSQNVISEFDPDAHSQSAEDWIRKVNETARIYGWTERQIIYYAIPKLSGHAKKWYQGRSTIDLNWKQWQRKIIKTFPDDRNYADRLTEMLSRRSRREESMEEYFHEKARLVKMCGIKGRNAVDCIISGIFDNGVR